MCCILKRVCVLAEEPDCNLQSPPRNTSLLLFLSSSCISYHCKGNSSSGGAWHDLLNFFYTVHELSMGYPWRCHGCYSKTWPLHLSEEVWLKTWRYGKIKLTSLRGTTWLFLVSIILHIWKYFWFAVGNEYPTFGLPHFILNYPNSFARFLLRSILLSFDRFIMQAESFLLAKYNCCTLKQRNVLLASVDIKLEIYWKLT